MPKLTIVTGPYGAGKSTLAEEISQKTGLEFLSPDAVEGVTDPKARHQTIMNMAKQAIANRESFAQDDVFRRTKVREIVAASKEAGYEIEAHIIGVERSRIARKRINSRRDKGGHWHPKALTDRHHNEAFRFAKRIIRYADTAIVYDNTKRNRRKIATLRNNNLTLQSSIPKWAEPIIKEMQKQSSERRQ